MLRVMTSIGLCLCLAQASLAALIYSDGFETVPGDAGPNLATSEGDFDPGWPYLAEPLSSRHLVVYQAGAQDSSSGLSASQIQPFEGNQALRIRAYGAAMADEIAASTEVTFSLVHLEPTPNASTARKLTVELRKGTDAAVMVGIDSDGVNWGFGYYDAADTFHRLADVQTLQWTSIAIHADADSGTFSVSYDGTLYDNAGAGYALRGTFDEFSAIRLSQFPNSSGTLNSYVDDVLVYDQIIPEPATAAIMLLGGGLAFARRRRG